MPPDAEAILIRFEGGPVDGDHQAMVPPAPWPPPEVIAEGNGGGVYERIAYSQLPGPMKGVMRGATYQWKEGGA